MGQGTNTPKNYEWTDGFNRFVLRETEPKDIILIKKDKVLGNSDLFYTGISYDNCYFIIVNDITVGIVYVSVEKNSLYIEWIELLAPFRGKGILKQVFKALVECFSVSTIRLESEKNILKNIFQSAVNLWVWTKTRNLVFLNTGIEEGEIRYEQIK